MFRKDIAVKLLVPCSQFFYLHPIKCMILYFLFRPINKMNKFRNFYKIVTELHIHRSFFLNIANSVYRQIVSFFHHLNKPPDKYCAHAKEKCAADCNSHFARNVIFISFSQSCNALINAISCHHHSKQSCKTDQDIYISF